MCTEFIRLHLHHSHEGYQILGIKFDICPQLAGYYFRAYTIHAFQFKYPGNVTFPVFSHIPESTINLLFYVIELLVSFSICLSILDEPFGKWLSTIPVLFAAITDKRAYRHGVIDRFVIGSVIGITEIHDISLWLIFKPVSQVTIERRCRSKANTHHFFQAFTDLRFIFKTCQIHTTVLNGWLPHISRARHHLRNKSVLVLYILQAESVLHSFQLVNGFNNFPCIGIFRSRKSSCNLPGL